MRNQEFPVALLECCSLGSSYSQVRRDDVCRNHVAQSLSLAHSIKQGLGTHQSVLRIPLNLHTDLESPTRSPSKWQIGRGKARPWVVSIPLEEVGNSQAGCTSKFAAGKQVSAGNSRQLCLSEHLGKLRWLERGCGFPSFFSNVETLLCAPLVECLWSGCHFCF